MEFFKRKRPDKPIERPAAAVPAEPLPPNGHPDYADGRFFDPLAVHDGHPRMVLTWVTNAEGQSGFSVDTWGVPAGDILNFYAGAATVVARHALTMKGTADATPDPVPQAAD